MSEHDYNPEHDYPGWKHPVTRRVPFRNQIIGTFTPPPEPILTEDPYRSQPLVNMDDDMIRITINLPIIQYRRFKQQFIELLAKIRRS
jgi:hypothetical protein